MQGLQVWHTFCNIYKRKRNGLIKKIYKVKMKSARKKRKLFKCRIVLPSNRYITKVKRSAKRYNRKYERSINRNPLKEI